jgi:hypothetical protein
MTKTIWFLALCLLGINYCCLLHAAVSPEELQKQNDFKKAYTTPDKLERKKACLLLEGLADSSSLTLLTTVCNGDADNEVRVEAFRVLSKAPVRDNSMARALAGIFQQSSNFDQKLEYAKCLENSQFKYVLCGAVSDWASRMRYPDLPKTPPPQTGKKHSPGNDGNAGNKNAAFETQINKERDDFSKAFAVFSTMTGASLKEPHSGSPLEIKKWWEANSTKVAAADNALLTKYKTEDQSNKKDAVSK